MYGNCSCIVKLEGRSVEEGGTFFEHAAGAVSGLCDMPCESLFVTYMVILAVMKFVGSTNRTGSMLVFFRCVLMCGGEAKFFAEAVCIRWCGER